MKKKNKQTGFTLLEVLVSLVILTVALSAIVTVGSMRAETLLVLREKNRALIVANTVLENYYLVTKQVTTGVFDGKQENGGVNWNWQISIATTNNNHIYRMDVKVSKGSNFEYSSAELVGFRWH